MVVHTALYAGTPVYLASLLHRHSPRRTLRSGGGLLLDVPRVNLERYGRRAFACAGPTLWNSATGTTRNPEHKAVVKTTEDISVLKLI